MRTNRDAHFGELAIDHRSCAENQNKLVIITFAFVVVDYSRALLG